MNPVDFVKGILEREAARFVAYGSMVAIAGATFAANALGVELSEEALVGVGAFAAVVVTEVIRQFVYSKKTVEREVEEAVEAAETP